MKHKHTHENVARDLQAGDCKAVLLDAISIIKVFAIAIRVWPGMLNVPERPRA